LHSWSYRELKKQIKARLYENTPKKEIQAVFQTKLPSVKPQEVFKDTYDFQFIELRSGQNEKDLENKMNDNSHEPYRGRRSFLFRALLGGKPPCCSYC